MVLGALQHQFLDLTRFTPFKKYQMFVLPHWWAFLLSLNAKGKNLSLPARIQLLGASER
jgi:hypothetical protein